jgi:hypothetical protein
MTIFTPGVLEGELEVNHRASPGLTENEARKMGYGGQLGLFREGGVARYKTLHCCHCGGCWVENPERVRERHHCTVCPTLGGFHQYVCDGCHQARQEPDYVHRNAEDLRDMLCSGKWRVAGGTLSKPILLPVIGD